MRAPARTDILGLLMLACTACGTRLPAQRPPDFAIRVDSSGGMVPTSSHASCDASRCVWSGMESGVPLPEQSASVTPAQIDALYWAVRAQAFDRIRLEKHGMVYDAGGTSVHVTAAGKSYDLGSSAEEGVAPDDRGRFDAVVSAVNGLIAALRTPSPPAPGGCDNSEIHATCTFAGVTVMDPATGAPLPLDASPGPDGTILYAIHYATPTGFLAQPYGRVRAAPGDRAALESFFRAHAEASCAQIVVRPPCPPSMDTTVQMPAPPVGWTLMDAEGKLPP